MAAFAGFKVLYLFIVLFVTAIGLIAAIWVGTYLFQGYIYTEPSPGLYWQAPATGLILTFGFTIWCLVVALSKQARPGDLPIDTVFRFSAKEDMLERPAKHIWAIKRDPKKTGDEKDGERVKYRNERVKKNDYQYYEDTTSANRPWHSQDVIAIELEKDDGTMMRFDLAPVGIGENRHFRTSDGWVMNEYVNGPTGIPVKFNVLRLLLNMLFNVAHFAAWFVCLWLLLRFRWPEALGFGAVMWLIVTLILLPVLLDNAANLAVKNRTLETAWRVPASEFVSLPNAAEPQQIFQTSVTGARLAVSRETRVKPPSEQSIRLSEKNFFAACGELQTLEYRGES